MLNTLKSWFNSNAIEPTEDTRINLPIKKYDPRQFDVYFKIKDLIEPLGVSQRKLYYDAASGKLHTFNRGNLKLVNLLDVLAYGFEEIPGFNEDKLKTKMFELLENNTETFENINEDYLFD